MLPLDPYKIRVEERASGSDFGAEPARSLEMLDDRDASLAGIIIKNQSILAREPANLDRPAGRPELLDREA